MEAKMMFRSVYTEISLNGIDFKPRHEYDIDWDIVIDISKKCGMVNVTEHVDGNKLTRVTIWERETSYIEWLVDNYIQKYIHQRDQYNKENNITSTLIFEELHNEIQSNSH